MSQTCVTHGLFIVSNTSPAKKLGKSEQVEQDRLSSITFYHVESCVESYSKFYNIC